MRRFVLCLLVACVSCQSEEICQVSAPSSLPVLYDKDDFLGRWEHVATVKVAGESTAVVGTSTSPQTIEWRFAEDLLFGVRDSAPAEPFVGFPIERHYTAGTFSDGARCVVSDDRPWYDRTHVRTDWSTEVAANPDGLPFEVEGAEVEVGSYLIDADRMETWPRFDRDDAGRLLEVEVWTSYWVRCGGCVPSEVVVSHRFRRLD